MGDTCSIGNFFFQDESKEAKREVPHRSMRVLASSVFKKTSPGLPRGKTPPMPCRPNYNLHMKAGGSPKSCFTASNFRRRFKSASLIRDVGLMGRKGRKTTRTQQGLFSFRLPHGKNLCGGKGDYFSSSSSSSNRSTEKCSYTSCSSSSSSMDSNSSSPFSSITERRMMIP